MTADSAAATPEEIAAPGAIAAPHQTPHSSAPVASAAFPITAAPLFWLALLLAMGLLVPFVPVPSRGAAIFGAVLLTVIYVVAVVLLAAHLTRLRLPLRDTLWWFALALAAWGALQFGALPIVGELFGALRAEETQPETAQLLLAVTVRTLADIALLSAAMLGGSLVARLIKSPNMLGPVCAIVALIDIWGVLFGGIVSQLMDKAPQVAATAMASMPTAGSAAPASRYVIPLPDIGAGDYLFLGLLFAALHGNGMNWQGAVKLTVPLMIGALLVVSGVLQLALILVGGPAIPPAPAMPGLLFIGLGVALPNLKFFQFTREEKFALLYAGVFVVVLTVALFFGVTNMLPKN